MKKAESDDKMVQELARQLGYFPFFGFLSSFNNLIDLASVGLIGSKAGFSQSADAQLKQVLSVSADALSTLAAEARRNQKLAIEAAEHKRKTKEEREEAKQILEKEGIKDGRLDVLAGNGAMSELGRGVEKEEGLETLCARLLPKQHVDFCAHKADRVVAGPSSLNTAKSVLTDDAQGGPSNEAEGLPVVILRGYVALPRAAIKVCSYITLL